MNRFLAAASALTVLALASQATAADLGARSAPIYSKAPEYVAVTNWSGWYVGGNVGWTGGSSSLDSAGVAVGNGDTANTAALVQTTNQHLGASSGVIGGAQFGYNYQITPSVIAGFEADIQGLGSSHQTSSASATMPQNGGTANPGVTTSITGSSQPSYLGTFRARLGVTAAPSLLLYATAGLAYGGGSSTTLTPSLVNADVTGPTELVSGSGSSGTRVGYAAGAGAEWMFASHWSTKLEYLHYDLGTATYSTGGVSFNEDNVGNINGGGRPSASTSTTVHFRNEIVRIGVNYHFN